ncbi:glycosyltransferase family 2 protein, partial [Flavobacteriales bacterium]|nr:glycosyltransferase family 2 protein [Flavobacteriales bacterium]
RQAIMSSAPTISVLTTVYNRAKYLGECIESVQQSKFKDYEHIIVDDGSTDDSVDIAKRYAEEDPKIKVFINDRNLGDYPNRNQAAKYATGKYLKYLDADDLHGAWILNVMVDAMEQYNEAGFGIIDHGPNVPIFPVLLTGSEAQDDYYSKRRNVLSRSPINVIIKKEAFQDVGGYSGKRMVGDFEMWHLLSQKNSLVIIPNGLALYRKHDDQEMTVHAKDPIWGFRYFLISQTQLVDTRNPMSESERTKHLSTIERKIARTVLTSIMNHGFRKADKMRREAGWSWSKVWQSAFS